MVILRGDLIKGVVLGDDGVGKTSLLMNYATNKFPHNRVPKLFDNYAGSIEFADKHFNLHLLDSTEQETTSAERQQICHGSHIVIICFSVVKPNTFINLKRKWLPEVQRLMRDTPVIVIGTHADMRSDPEVLRELQSYGKKATSYREAASWSRREGVAAYIEFSPSMKKRWRRVLNDALITVLSPKDKRLKSCFCKAAFDW